MAKPLVIVFARAPRYGAVKTRLARDIGAAEALRFYRGALRDLLRRVAHKARWETILAVTPDRSSLDRTLWPSGIAITRQDGGDLGRRMIAALRRAGARPAVLIGCDIPELSADHVAAAFRALGSRRFVLGPARDGGYWLIGARHPNHLKLSVLDGVRWSSAHTLQDSAARLGDVAVLGALLDDIDDGAAYSAFVRRTRLTRSCVAP